MGILNEGLWAPQREILQLEVSLSCPEERRPYIRTEGKKVRLGTPTPNPCIVPTNSQSYK